MMKLTLYWNTKCQGLNYDPKKIKKRQVLKRIYRKDSSIDIEWPTEAMTNILIIGFGSQDN